MVQEKPWLSKFKKDFKNKKVLILGLGVLGRGVADAQFFVQMGSQVTVTDLKKNKELQSSLDKLKDLPIKFVLGQHRKEDVLKADLILRNAAISKNSPFLKLARENNVRIEMDEALFAQYAPTKIIGITGTRGKSTTTALIYQMIKKAGFSVWLAGNIKGRATLPLLAKIRKGDWLVMELSSWQLQGFQKLKISPHIGIFTNIYQDHLNRYSSMEEYIQDKKTIFKYQNRNDFAVLNHDSLIVKELAQEVKSQVVWFSKKDLNREVKELIKLKGEHNQENVAAALKVSQILKIKPNIIKQVLQHFSSLPHRLEKIGEIKGVVYINDTTSTTPASGMAALNSFKEPIILICGGASKNLEMSDFAKRIAQKVKKIILLEGTETDNLESLIKKFQGQEKIVGRFNNFKKAVLKAKFLARKGEIVLLSPGCASFGMFQNEFDRGDKFRKIVKNL